MDIEFTKTVSAGNDFLQIMLPGNLSSGRKRALVVDVCDRRRGIGADGVVFYNRESDTVHFEIFNRDGSEAEISGNGMAGAAAVIFDRSGSLRRLKLLTAAGEKTAVLVEKRDRTTVVDVEIGRADFADRRFFPFLESGRSVYTHDAIQFYPVSVGNPHAVVMAAAAVASGDWTVLAERLAHSAIFPLGVNVEVVGDGTASGWPVAFYERGVGVTESSSTGSAAVHAILADLGLHDGESRLGMPGNRVRVYGTDPIRVENHTRIVYSGVYRTSI